MYTRISSLGDGGIHLVDPCAARVLVVALPEGRVSADQETVEVSAVSHGGIEPSIERYGGGVSGYEEEEDGEQEEEASRYHGV